MACAEDLEQYYRVPPDLRDLNYGKYFDTGEPSISTYNDYNSHNTRRLNVSEMSELLLKIGWIKDLSHAGRGT